LCRPPTDQMERKCISAHVQCGKRRASISYRSLRPSAMAILFLGMVLFNPSAGRRSQAQTDLSSAYISTALTAPKLEQKPTKTRSLRVQSNRTIHKRRITRRVSPNRKAVSLKTAKQSFLKNLSDRYSDLEHKLHYSRKLWPTKIHAQTFSKLIGTSLNVMEPASDVAA